MPGSKKSIGITQSQRIEIVVANFPAVGDIA